MDSSALPPLPLPSAKVLTANAAAQFQQHELDTRVSRNLRDLDLVLDGKKKPERMGRNGFMHSALTGPAFADYPEAK